MDNILENWPHHLDIIEQEMEDQRNEERFMHLAMNNQEHVYDDDDDDDVSMPTTREEFANSIKEVFIRTEGNEIGRSTVYYSPRQDVVEMKEWINLVYSGIKIEQPNWWTRAKTYWSNKFSAIKNVGTT